MSPVPQEPARVADWEAFYRDYRKPGYVAGFEITTKLGGGAFGIVFRARRLSIGKDYAIKFLQVDDVEVRKAILAELEAVKLFAQIDHPNLVSIEDRGEVDGIPFLVMAFAGTETLRDRLPQGRPPSAEEKDELLRCFLQASRGLQALHERSLVHFDIKPANVFLKGSVARLGDYGLSKLVTHSRGSLSMGRGTPYYMAPELLQRRGDHRSDIYSLGVLLYELLCGVVPFRGDSEWEVLKAHETKAPDLPEYLTARERMVLQRCLAKDPAARFQSVQDVIAAFGAPSSVGAAAWSEVRAGATGASPGPASAATARPMPEPPPLPGEGVDPYTGLGRAGMEAARHGRVIAGEAVQAARKLSAQVVQEVSKGLQNYRRQRGSRLRRRANRPAAGPVRSRAGVAWALVFATMLLVCGFVVMLMLGSTGASPQLTVLSNRAESTFRSYRLPMGYERLVATSEPSWARLASTDAETAKAQLQQRMEQLRALAPLAAAARHQVLQLPEFDTLNLDAGSLKRLRAELQQLAASDAPEAQAADLATAEPASLAVAAALLAETRWLQPEDLERARRLHHWLQQATGCYEIEFVDDASLPLAELRQVNQPIGKLWQWFVNEFAHTPRTWQAYRELMHR